MARLEVPRLGIREIVLSGTSGRSLAFGPGHMDGTAGPGEAGNCVLAGHRDTSFAFLEQLVAGDAVILETPSGRRVEYRVTDLRVVDQRDTWLAAETAIPTLTLVTCWPFHALTSGGPGRYVVRAETVQKGESGEPK